MPGVIRFAENPAVQRDCGIGSQHRERRQVAQLQRSVSRFGLGAANPPDIVIWRFAGMGSFIHIDIAARIGAQQQQLEADADLFEQFAAARALRGQVNACLDNGHVGLENYN
jgi:hypothetical protein